MPSKSIPDRWLDYTPLGDSIEGTRFIPCKVPLKKILHENNSLPKEQEFTPSRLFEILEEKKLKIGLLIDLTFTRRYYDSEEIISKDCEYTKVFTAGHHVPAPDVVRKFTSVVTKFQEENADNDLLIGVHCTHGVNRTGYLICRYMIDHLDFKPEDALKAYEKARGYPVERKNYIADLHTRPRSDDEEEEQEASDLQQNPYSMRGQNNMQQRQEDDYGRRGGNSDWSRDYSTDSHVRHPNRYQPYNRDYHGPAYYQDNYYGGPGGRHDSYYQPQYGDYNSYHSNRDPGWGNGYDRDQRYNHGDWNQGRRHRERSPHNDRHRERSPRNDRHRERSPHNDRSANQSKPPQDGAVYQDRRRRGSASIRGGQ